MVYGTESGHSLEEQFELEERYTNVVAEYLMINPITKVPPPQWTTRVGPVLFWRGQPAPESS